MSTAAQAALLTAAVFGSAAVIIAFAYIFTSMILSDSLAAKICSWLMLAIFSVGGIFGLMYLALGAAS